MTWPGAGQRSAARFTMGALCTVALLVGMMSCSRNGFSDRDDNQSGDSDSDSPDSDSDDDQPAAVSVGTLSAAWTTPNQVKWTWQPDGNGDLLAAYELITGLDQADVESRSGSAKIWTTDELPALAYYTIPRTTGVEIVSQAITSGHLAATLYYAQLTARDSAGLISTSNVASARTAVTPVDAIVLFSDAEPDGYSLPEEFVWSTDRPYAGTNDLTLIVDCAGEAECWENLRRQELTIDVSELTPGAFESAYLELAIANGSTQPAWWSDLGLNLGSTCVDDCLADYTYLTIPASDTYTLVQIPLRQFQLSTSALTSQAVTTDGLNGFRIGGQWTDGATLRVDEVRVRW